MNRLQSARRGACTSEARVLRFLPRGSERIGAHARYTRNPPHQVSIRVGTSEHGRALRKTAVSLAQ